MEYVNRRGDRYYIFQGTTKTGKPKYFASMRETSQKGELVPALPDEFEVFENPSNAAVFVRRKKTSRVLPAERDLVDRLAVELSNYSVLQTVVDGDQIVVYTPDRDPEATVAAFSRIFGPLTAEAADWTKRQTTFSAKLRFKLHDVDQRTYIAERYCYRSSVEGWIEIHGPAQLDTLVRKLVPHLGRQSFYDLI